MKFRKELCLVFLVSFLYMSLISSAYAASEGTIDAIKEPLDRVYFLIQSVVSIVAVLVITGSGFMYMTSGSNIQARENAKHMLTYAIIGLALIWIAPSLVSFLTA